MTPSDPPPNDSPDSFSSTRLRLLTDDIRSPILWINLTKTTVSRHAAETAVCCRAFAARRMCRVHMQKESGSSADPDSPCA
ncbi:hypothetical protein GCM10027416_13960 [Okibacterium endophyticum]